MLEIKDIYKTFNAGTINERKALQGVSLKLVAGVWPVDSGSIIIDDVDVTGMPEHKRAKFLGRVFQDPMNGTAATMQIDENLAMAYRRGKRRTLKWGIKKERKRSNLII